MRVVALATLASRVLGMVRDILFAGLFGLGPIGDAFLFAFRIPNLARKLFGEGALSAAFLPAFARELEVSRKTAQPSAWELASAVFALMAGFLITLTILGELVLWWIARSTDSPDARLLLGLTAVMLPYAVLICLAAQVTAVLHALEHFTWPALVPVALNVKLQGASAHILHDHVDGFIGAEKILHTDDVWMRDQRQRAAFFEEALQTVAEHGKVLVGVDAHIRAVRAHHQRGGQILLNGIRCTGFIMRQIDNRKPARRKDLVDRVVLQLIALRQRLVRL